MVSARKHAHYFRDVSHLSELDIYRVLDLFNVTDHALGHAIKKLVAPGGRGAGKDFRRDVQEAVDTLMRRLEMLDEDATAGAEKVCQIKITAWPPIHTDADWNKWEGGPCPYAPETTVQVRMRRGTEHIREAGGLDWSHDGQPGDIIACRVVGHS